jgi:hypothetical protein
MNIGILGSGDVGRRLGDGFIELGHNVKIGRWFFLLLISVSKVNYKRIAIYL